MRRDSSRRFHAVCLSECRINEMHLKYNMKRREDKDLRRPPPFRNFISPEAQGTRHPLKAMFPIMSRKRSIPRAVPPCGCPRSGMQTRRQREAGIFEYANSQRTSRASITLRSIQEARRTTRAGANEPSDLAHLHESRGRNLQQGTIYITPQ